MSIIETMPRRANLNGTRLPDGRWQVRVTLTRLDGAKIRKAFYGETLQEAQAKAHGVIYESGRALLESVTLNELAEAWRTSWRVKPATARSYEYALSLILPSLGRTECHELKLPRIAQLIKGIDTDRKARLVRVVLGTLLEFGRQTGAIETNPLLGARIGRSYRPGRKRLAGIPPDADLFFRFLADTGLRPWKEAITLTVADFGYSADEWFVSVQDSKSDAGRRVVPITDQSIAHELAQVKTGRLFPHSESTYKRRWREMQTGAPIYALRRLAITKWCESGLPLDVIQRRAGHADLRLTLEVYNEVQRHRVLSEGINKGIKVSEVVGSDA